MTDQNLTTDLHPEDMEHARAYVEDFLDATYAPDRTLAVARVLDALLPAPKRPTLAGMTEEERDACRWMQADVEHRGRAVVIVPEWGAGHAELLNRWGSAFYAAHDTVTPRPDLPRMEWPGDQKPDSSLPEGWRLADHPDYGRVVVTTSEPDGDGEVYFVFRDDELSQRHDLHWCKPAELTYIDTTSDVPPNTLAVGSVWIGVDALTRACEESGRDQIVVSDFGGYVSVWSHDAEWWEGSTPPRTTPYTIIHTGKEADQ